MKSLITILIVVVSMAVAAYFLTSMVIKPNFAPSSASAGANGEDHGSQSSEEHGEGEGGTNGEVYLVPDILVNPTGTGGTRYLSATVGLEVSKPETAAALKSRDIQVRDVLISILSARSVEQLTDFRSREQMRGEIRQRLNKLLGNEELSAVYFVDYVLQ